MHATTPPDSTHHKLQERIKELTALHSTARLLQDDARPALDVVRDVVAMLPSAWQYPEIAAAHICCCDLDAATPGFQSSPWMQTASFTVRDGETGTLEIAYREARPGEAEGPFLAEERDLIESLAEMLRSYFQRKRADAEIQAAYGNLERLVAERTAQLQEQQSRLRELATKQTLIDARERREIAVHLHDEIIQEFAFIKLRVAQFRGDAVFCGFERNLEDIISLLEGAIQHTRRLTFELSSPILYELGLAAALEWLAEQYQQRHKLRVSVHNKATSAELSEAVRVTLFQSVRELLTNAVKYAGCQQVTIELRSDQRQLAISVTDDGAGFEVTHVDSATSHGFGLFSIRERLRYFGGGMHVQSVSGKGTSIELSVPLETEPR
jgi:signal transduction histidine kinase